MSTRYVNLKDEVITLDTRTILNKENRHNLRTYRLFELPNDDGYFVAILLYLVK